MSTRRKPPLEPTAAGAPTPSKRPTGRAPKLTEAVIAKMASLLRAGVDVKTAALATGIPKSTFYYWMEEAKAGKKGVHQLLLDSVERSQAEARARLVLSWSGAAAKDWRAARALLAVLDPEQYALPNRLRVPNLEEDDDESGEDQRRIRFFIPAEDGEAEAATRASEAEAEALEGEETDEEPARPLRAFGKAG